MTDLVPLQRALISLSDKSGLAELAAALQTHGVELISTGGTATALRTSGAAVTSIEDVTRFPEMLDGRVKTLHPAVHGGILARRDVPAHTDALADHQIRGVDLVCINLYPFEATVRRPGVSLEEAIEQIDIGGPAMIRSAAKNAEWVCVVTDASQYAELVAELERHGGRTTLAFRRRLALAALQRTAAYDGAIATWLAANDPAVQTGSVLPERLHLNLVRSAELRYGENPHQAAAAYVLPTAAGASVLRARQLHGKPLSYNNLADASAALEAVRALRAVDGDAASACIVKHTNPCGLALAPHLPEATLAALDGDPVAAYGGIIALSEAVDVLTAEHLTREGMFLEVVLAPAFAPEALELLQSRWKMVRVLEVGPIDAAERGEIEFRSIPGGALVQERDLVPPAPETWKHAAGPAPTREQLQAAAVLEVAARSLTSNAVAIGGQVGKSVALFGAGAGQMDRVASCRIAIEKAGERARGGVASSDAFFPFADGPKLLIEAGVALIVHPGGSKRDEDTFAACDAAGVTCLVTGVRRFRH